MSEKNTTIRPQEHLIVAGRLYSRAWKLVDQIRSGRGANLPEWPAWCFLPLAGVYAIVADDFGHHELPTHLAVDIGRLGALAAWRVTQGIYRFDPTLYAELIRTPLDNLIPVEVLHHLPEWCVYLETPGLLWDDQILHGTFVHLEWDVNTGHEELRLLLDIEDGLIPVPIHLGGDVRSGLGGMVAEAQRQLDIRELGTLSISPASLSTAAKQLQPILALVLYLCSQAAEIGATPTTRPKFPQPRRTKEGWRLFPPPSPTVWPVGTELGIKLRQSLDHLKTEPSSGRASPRPHVRGPHWHGYWSGPRNGERVFDLRWMPPIPVNLAEDNSTQES